MKDSYLPIGTIVILKDSNQKIMITGYFGSDESKKAYEYTGVIYPNGIIDSNKGTLFNHRSIKTIIYNGLIDEEVDEHLKNVMNISKRYTSIISNVTSKILKDLMEREKNV